MPVTFVFLKALSGISVIIEFSPNVTVCKFQQFSNAPTPRYDTDEGILISRIASLDLNASFPILTNVDGKTAERRL